MYIVFLFFQLFFYILYLFCIFIWDLKMDNNTHIDVFWAFLRGLEELIEGEART